VRVLCRVLQVSSSGYYDWVKRPLSIHDTKEAILKLEIKAAHKRTRETYGAKRLQEDLASQGIQVGEYRIRRIRKELGLKCKQNKKFKVTTNSNHSLAVAENLLNQDFEAYSPNETWVTDLTYIWTDEGWLYLAGHKDLFTGEIVGYAMGKRMTKNLVSQSLFRAVSTKKPPTGLIHHSDRGSQYCSIEYRKLLEQFGMKASMSRKGNCYDNAPIESFWGTLKNELVFHRHYKTREEAKKDITEYIEIFYNRLRKQEKLAYLSPAAFERKYYTQHYIDLGVGDIG